MFPLLLLRRRYAAAQKDAAICAQLIVNRGGRCFLAPILAFPRPLRGFYVTLFGTINYDPLATEDQVGFT